MCWEKLNPNSVFWKCINSTRREQDSERVITFFPPKEHFLPTSMKEFILLCGSLFRWSGELAESIWKQSWVNILGKCIISYIKEHLKGKHIFHLYKETSLPQAGRMVSRSFPSFRYIYMAYSAVPQLENCYRRHKTSLPLWLWTSWNESESQQAGPLLSVPIHNRSLARRVMSATSYLLELPRPNRRDHLD